MKRTLPIFILMLMLNSCGRPEVTVRNATGTTLSDLQVLVQRGTQSAVLIEAAELDDGDEVDAPIRNQKSFTILVKFRMKGRSYEVAPDYDYWDQDEDSPRLVISANGEVHRDSR